MCCEHQENDIWQRMCPPLLPSLPPTLPPSLLSFVPLPASSSRGRGSSAKEGAGGAKGGGRGPPEQDEAQQRRLHRRHRVQRDDLRGTQAHW